ncbi:hypothetical protein JOF28_002559 [Leucobacter exalbidus]|uniref:Uncharacterized protein n=1 Tax=Leucobacter exalbidus TaxID=662960 RepID=A0A940PUR4_9MICO|nr:hypothetical protein [Leucobacter exalbidus]
MAGLSTDAIPTDAVMTGAAAMAPSRGHGSPPGTRGNPRRSAVNGVGKIEADGLSGRSNTESGIVVSAVFAVASAAAPSRRTASVAMPRATPFVGHGAPPGNRGSPCLSCPE